MQNEKLSSQLSHLIGLNMTVIPVGNDKKPLVAWKKYQKSDPTIDEIDSFLAHWRNGALFGIVHRGDYICIDIDADKTSRNMRGEVDKIYNELCKILDLGENYCWGGSSLSGAGRHIWLLTDAPNDVTRRVYTYRGAHIHQIELRVSACYTVLPRNGYSDDMWVATPAYRDYSEIVNAIQTIAPDNLPTPTPTHSERVSEPLSASRGHSRYVQVTLDNLSHQIANAVVGNRNNTLYECALKAGSLIAGGVLDERNVVDALASAARQCGLAEGEINATIRSGLETGKRNPYTPTPRAVTPTPTATPTPQTLTDDLCEWVNERNLSDAGNAEIIERIASDRLRWDAINQQWRIYRNGVWVVDDRDTARQIAVEAARLRYQCAASIDDLEQRRRAAVYAIRSEDKSRIDGALTMARSMLAETNWLRDTGVVVSRNGYIIDLRDGSARPAHADDLAVQRLGADYDPNADCPLFIKFLNDIFNNDNEKIEYVRAIFGYALTGETTEQKVFLNVGKGANGKSVLLGLMNDLFGDYAASVPFALFDAGEYTQTAQYEFAKLVGKRFVSIIEAPEDRFLAEARLKAASGGDTIQARNPYGRPFDYKPQWVVFFAINHLPRVRGDDRGIWRRLRVIDYPNSYEGREDKTLPARLRNELPGILNWLIAGAQRWYEQGLIEPASVTNATKRYKEDQDQIARWIADCVELRAGNAILFKQVYESYTNWCKVYGEHNLSSKGFSDRLRAKGIATDRRAGSIYVLGIKLREI